MRYHALATDYDGTLATGGRVSQPAIVVLEQLRASGRRLILVTGRELGDLEAVFSRLDLFDRVVAENGAVLYRPASGDRKVLAERPPEAFIRALRERQVQPLAVGDAIVATHRMADLVVLQVIAALGLDLQVIFNRESMMILPSGVNKATGLSAALEELELSPHNVVGIGDAENDLTFLTLCECGVAVANAIPLLTERADLVTRAEAGDGVVEIARRLLATDLADIAGRLRRHDLLLGRREDGSEFRLPPYGLNLLIAGPTAGATAGLTTAFIDRLDDQGYQVCIIDPSGAYEGGGMAATLGNGPTPPQLSGLRQVLGRPTQQVTVNLLGITLEDRPAFFDSVLAQLQDFQARIGRPHWIVIDEAHQLLPAFRERQSRPFPRELTNLALITSHPDRVAEAVLSLVDLAIAFDRPDRVLGAAVDRLGIGGQLPSVSLAPGEAMAAGRWTQRNAVRFEVAARTGEQRRYTLAG
jgi:HAD superfamily hydrolase (TIGR01484 family)